MFLHLRRLRAAIGLAVVSQLLASCAGAPSGAIESGARPALASRAVSKSGGSTPISHVVIVVQENRSFDDLFATYPGADGATQGNAGGKQIPLQKVSLADPCDFGHDYNGFRRDYDGGKMDGFNQEGGGRNAPAKPARAPISTWIPRK